jgi:hypothetical protein
VAQGALRASDASKPGDDFPQHRRGRVQRPGSLRNKRIPISSGTIPHRDGCEDLFSRRGTPPPLSYMPSLDLCLVVPETQCAPRP